jgi:hypothetical protein
MKIMKLAVLSVLLLPAASAFALMDLSAFGGYTTLAMGQVNSSINQAPANFTKTTIQNGFYVGADGGFTVFPFLKIGPRVEYVQANPGSADLGSITTTLNTNLIMGELGITVDSSLPLTGLSVIGGLYGGYGEVNGTLTSAGQGFAYDGTINGDGGGFVGEVAAQLRYKLVAGLSIGLDLGYRLADIATVNQDSTTIPANANNNGKPLIYQSNSNTAGDAFDFSGLNIGGAVSFDF